MPKSNKKGVKRIVNLTVNEFSPVDKPAIGEEFIIIKSLDGKKPLESFNQVIEKGISWKSSIEKSESEGVCQFCKIEGGSEPKLGLKCGVCFSCAFDRVDKGVFDQCLAGSFNFEEYKAKHPKEFEDAEKALIPNDSMNREELKKSLEERSDEFDVEVREDAALTFPAGFPTDLEDYADPVNLKFPIDTEERTRNARVRFKQFASSYKEETSKAVVHERIVRRELKFGINPGFDPENPLDQLLPGELKEELQKGSNIGGEAMKDSLEKIQKQFSELKAMLEQSLALHDEAARALNQIVELNVMALEQVAMLTEAQGEGADGQGEASPTPEQTEMMAQISTFKAEISKVGAKISSDRLSILQEISEKLSNLIRSVMGGKKDGKKKDLSKATEGLVSRIQSLESSVEAIRNESTNKIEAIGKRLNEIENTAAGSAGLDDEDDNPGDGKDNKEKSVFSDLIGLDDIKTRISRREALLNKPKSNA